MNTKSILGRGKKRCQHNFKQVWVAKESDYGAEAALLPQAAQEGQQDAPEGLEQLSAGGSPAADTWAALSRANMTGQGLGSIEQPSLQKQVLQKVPKLCPWSKSLMEKQQKCG